MKKTQIFPNNEVYEYEETEKTPVCFDCKYTSRDLDADPCSDCEGLKNTGRSYFEEA